MKPLSPRHVWIGCASWCARALVFFFVGLMKTIDHDEGVHVDIFFQSFLCAIHTFDIFTCGSSGRDNVSSFRSVGGLASLCSYTAHHVFLVLQSRRCRRSRLKCTRHALGASFQSSVLRRSIPRGSSRRDNVSSFRSVGGLAGLCSYNAHHVFLVLQSRRCRRSPLKCTRHALGASFQSSVLHRSIPRGSWRRWIRKGCCMLCARY